MDYTVQEHGGRRVLPVPAGLRELASDISREVLRAQPHNIFGFAADYLAAMLRARASAVAAAEAVGYMLEHDVTFGALLQQRGVDLDEATRACIVIQAAFRGYCTRRDFRESGALAMCDPVRRRYGVGRDVAERAIARIQAAFRGYMVRKILKHQQTGPNAWLADSFPRSKIIQYLLRTVPLDVANKAATKIQAVFRGYAVRQDLQQTIYEEVRKEIWMKRTGSVVASEKPPAKDYALVAAEDILATTTDETARSAESGAADARGTDSGADLDEEAEEEEEEEEEAGEEPWNEAAARGRPSVLRDDDALHEEDSREAVRDAGDEQVAKGPEESGEASGDSKAKESGAGAGAEATKVAEHAAKQMVEQATEVAHAAETAAEGDATTDQSTAAAATGSPTTSAP